MRAATDRLLDALDRCDKDTIAIERVRDLVAHADPWDRNEPLHVTASALVVHPPTRRVLLRWHARLERWMQVGGHADPDEHDPLLIAVREAQEETGLSDLRPWPPGREDPVQITVVGVPAHSLEPTHEHADIRYVLATGSPERATPESERAPVRWTDIDDALDEIDEDNLTVLIRRTRDRLDADG